MQHVVRQARACSRSSLYGSRKRDPTCFSPKGSHGGQVWSKWRWTFGGTKPFKIIGSGTFERVEALTDASGWIAMELSRRQLVIDNDFAFRSHAAMLGVLADDLRLNRRSQWRHALGACHHRCLLR